MATKYSLTLLALPFLVPAGLGLLGGNTTLREGMN